MLHQRVLAVIAKHPGIALSELRSAFREIPRETLEQLVSELTRARAVERCGHALLRATEQSMTQVRYEESGFIQPPSRDRLMAGR